MNNRRSDAGVLHRHRPFGFDAIPLNATIGGAATLSSGSSRHAAGIIHPTLTRKTMTCFRVKAQKGRTDGEQSHGYSETGSSYSPLQLVDHY